MNRAQELADPQGMFLRLHARLHPERAELSALLEAGMARHTLLQLYPFEPQEWFEPLVAAVPAPAWAPLRELIIPARARILRMSSNLTWPERVSIGRTTTAFNESETGKKLTELLQDAKPEEPTSGMSSGTSFMLESLLLAADWPVYAHVQKTAEGGEYRRLFAGVERVLWVLAP